MSKNLITKPAMYANLKLPSMFMADYQKSIPQLLIN